MFLFQRISIKKLTKYYFIIVKLNMKKKTQKYRIVSYILKFTNLAAKLFIHIFL